MPRHLRRVALILSVGACALVLSACAREGSNQLGFQNGAFPPDEGLSTVEAIALFALAPLALLLVVAAVVWLPGVVRSSRYRPGRGWGASPLWFGGPPDPVAAVEAASPDELTRGGASGSW